MLDLDYERSRALLRLPDRRRESHELLLQVYERSRDQLGDPHPVTQRYWRRLHSTLYT
jgi:hypothetical protein